MNSSKGKIQNEAKSALKIVGLTCLFSSLLARIFRFLGCKSAVFCELSLVEDVDDADGLGAFVGSLSVFSGLLGLVVFMFDVVGQLSTVELEAGVAGFVDSTRAVTDDVVFVDVAVVVVLVCVTGAGDGELLCN